MLEEDTYIPTFNKAPRTNNNKSLVKNASNKSIDNPSVSPNLSVPVSIEKPRNNMFQLHKDSRKEATTTFEDFFKHANSPKK